MTEVDIDIDLIPSFICTLMDHGPFLLKALLRWCLVNISFSLLSVQTKVAAFAESARIYFPAGTLIVYQVT